jgi:hypothetical protein
MVSASEFGAPTMSRLCDALISFCLSALSTMAETVTPA